MKSQIILITAALTVLMFIDAPANAQATHKKNPASLPSGSDSALFHSLVTQYTQSIDRADTLLASKLWAHTDEISFIHPRGHEYGWSGVKKIIKMFRDNFTVRKLTFFNLKPAVYKDVAWVEFYWVFDATMKMNDSPVQTRGRETQIWRKINSEWRLVHVHYSGMPVTGEGQGF